MTGLAAGRESGIGEGGGSPGRALIGRGMRGVGPPGGVQLLGGAQRAGRLSGVLLGLAEPGNRLGERGQPGDQHERPERRVAGDVPVGRQQPGGPPQAIAGRRGRGDTAVGCPGCAVVRVGGLAENPAAQRRGGHAQGVGRGPGRVRGQGRISPGMHPDLNGRVISDAGGVVPDRAALGRGERVIPASCPEHSSGGAAWAGSGRRRVSRPRTRPATRPWWCRRAGRRRTR